MTAPAAALESALRSIGIEGRVEARESLAVLVPDGEMAPLADPATRRRAAALAREHGFTHLALELLDGAGRVEGGAAADGR